MPLGGLLGERIAKSMSLYNSQQTLNQTQAVPKLQQQMSVENAYQTKPVATPDRSILNVKRTIDV